VWFFAIASAAMAQTVDATQWNAGLFPLNQSWRVHDGDDPAWARPDFDDTDWKQVNLDDFPAAEPGWRWYRLHVKLADEHPMAHLLIQGGDGTYELYVNGRKMDGPRLRSWFGVSRPTERVVWVGAGFTNLDLALRTHAPGSYTVWHLPLFLGFQMGTPDVVDTAQAASQSQRLYAVIPSIAINLCLILAGLAALALFLGQRARKEYRWLGLYLLLLGLSNLFLNCSAAGVIPLAWNILLGDPLIFLFAIMQVEFTFSFVGRPVGRIWRAYEVLLVLALIPAAITQAGLISSSTYVAMQAILILPAALVLPVLLLVWYRQGNREAGWLILPSLLPAAATAAFDLGTVSIFTGWGKLDSLADPISLGPVPLQLADAGDFLFLLAIGVVMFFRFTRVSREQARASAELEAAREIQQRLVPAKLPEVKGYTIETAYFPAQEVGGDFYQVLEQAQGTQLVVVGDVSGKGLKAAMTGTLALGALRTLAAEGLEPAAMLTRLNRQLSEMQDGGFITCVCVRITEDGEVTVANAGHIAPYRNGEELTVGADLPLGISAQEKYCQQTLHLQSGDRLTLLSDGVLEARNARGELFGFEETRKISMLGAGQIAEAARRFGQEDDITVLTLIREELVAPGVLQLGETTVLD
jgi:hypothetical protein